MSQRTTPLRPIATAHHPAGAGRGSRDRRHSRVTRARRSPSAPPRWSRDLTAHVTTETGMLQRTTPLRRDRGARARRSRVTRARWPPSAPPRWEPTATAHVTTEAGMSQRTTPLEPKYHSAPPR